MKRPTFQHRHVFIGLVVCLLISSFLPAGAARVLSTLPRVVVEMVTSPFAAPLKSLGDAVRQPAPPTFALTDTNNVIELRDNIEQMYQLNHRLRLENEQLHRELAQVRAIPEQMRPRSATFKTCRVTQSDLHGGQATITINRGTRHNVRQGCIAVSGMNLVGQVTHAGPNTATVALITSPSARPFVQLAAINTVAAPRPITIQLTADRDGRAFEAVVDKDQPVGVEDVAILVDQRWPEHARGFVVGKVVKVDDYPKDPHMRNRVHVQPMRSLEHLPAVTVIVDEPQTLSMGEAQGF